MSPSAAVVRGKDGWLYYGDDGGSKTSPTRACCRRRVANWREAIVRARDWCRARGIAYVFTIAPDKHVIYPEIPRRSRPPADAALARRSGFHGARRTPASSSTSGRRCWRRKSHERLFHQTDTHWNDRGAFVAYQQIIDAVRGKCRRCRRRARGRRSTPLSGFVSGRDLAAMMGLKRVLQRGRPAAGAQEAGRGTSSSSRAAPTRRRAKDGWSPRFPGSTLPRAVVFRDSFTSALAPFLSEHFSRAVYLWQNDFDAMKC